MDSTSLVSKRSKLPVLGLLSALTVLVTAALVWAFGVSHIPVLAVADAAKIISATPEFNRSYGELDVKGLYMGRNSWEATCLVDVSFKVDRTLDTVNGRAFFQYWDHEWHLTTLYYGTAPNVITVKSPLVPGSHTGLTNGGRAVFRV
jgi:hypothetical protein